MVVNAAGTGGRGRLEGRDVAGKTGTAQVISLQGGKAAKGRTDKDLRDHGWFVFFAPRDNPVIAGVIFAEHAEHGYRRKFLGQHVDRDSRRGVARDHETFDAAIAQGFRRLAGVAPD